MTEEASSHSVEEAEEPGVITNDLLRDVVPVLRHTDDQFWDDLDAGFAISSSVDSSDRFFTDVNWLAYLLRNDPESALPDVTRADRNRARAFLGMLIFTPQKAIEEAGLPPNVVKRLTRVIKVYGPVVDRAYERSFRADDWETIDLGVSNPIGSTVDPQAIIKVVIQRFDGQKLTLQTRPDGIARLARALLRSLNESLDDELIEDPDIEADILDGIAESIRQLANRISSEHSGQDDNDTDSNS